MYSLRTFHSQDREATINFDNMPKPFAKNRYLNPQKSEHTNNEHLTLT